jgi:excisionase family DNA binding protein
MAANDGSLRLTARDLADAFADPAWAAKFPPVLSVDQAAALLQVPKATVYDWRSRGLLQGCSRRVGKHVRFFRDKLILQIFNDGIHANAE